MIKHVVHNAVCAPFVQGFAEKPKRKRAVNADSGFERDFEVPSIVMRLAILPTTGKEALMANRAVQPESCRYRLSESGLIAKPV